MSEEYNGWTNRETWATMLYIDNDQWLQETALNYAREEVQGHDEGEEINPYYLGETIKNWIEEELLTLENVSEIRGLWLMLTDIGSLYRVNYKEIAETLLSYVKEEVSA